MASSPGNARDEVIKAVGSDRVLLSESFSIRFDKGPGDAVELPTRNGPHSFPIAAVYYDYALEVIAISDIRNRRFHFFERSRRADVGWAGASKEHYHVWNDDREVRLDGDDHLLKAGEKEYAIELRLSPKKPPVLHGKRGLSQKGPTEGNASRPRSPLSEARGR